LALFHSFTGKYVSVILLSMLLVCFSTYTFSQKTDTTDKVTIHILDNDHGVYIKTDTGETTKLIGHVQLEQGGNMMYCDSAYLDAAHNNFEGFGNVKIIQPGGTDAKSDYLHYVGDKKMAYMHGNVTLTDAKGKLHCEELTYDLTTKIGIYNSGGSLQNDSTIVTSEKGVYNSKTKVARFTKKVYIEDPTYHIISEDLEYSTDTKLVRFFAYSVVKSKKSELRTSNGTYDSKRDIANFEGRSSIINEDQYIEADTIDYNSITGFGKAKGNVITIDTTQHTTLYSGYAEYNKKTRRLLAVIKPVLKTVSGQDSLFMRADTFYSAPIPKPSDTVKKIITTKVKKKNKKGVPPTVIEMRDTTTNVIDSTRPRYFIGYHHVRVFSDSLQGKCDSISYSQKDSLIRMMYAPVAWARNSQITGDTILLYLHDSNKIKNIYIPDKAFVVSQSGPAKANMYDQVQGKTLNGNFKNNELVNMLVTPNAQCIYYAKDDSGAYLGVNQGTSERMRVLFNDSKIDKVIFEQDVKQTMTPFEKAKIAEMRLSRFQWLIEQRPKSLAELFE